MCKKMLFTALAVMLSVSVVVCQDLLDVDKVKDSELFVVKKGYDVQQRLKEIESIVGKDVTVYEVSGKQNKIKAVYTGKAEMASHPKFSDRDKASLIVVRTFENGVMRAYFPLTNNNKYRIYLKEAVK
ncbi:hypothetical protein KK062_18770 [Fulvivirgaceae bacterium PWU5]|uniref:Uncharacterized protein n=1 Tax=Dawidia cretensis TaxID=2782350 RepID=A0AAP2E260_9BACT|nr:hypothetical protein [Dawidia cretensis]MBT1710297.1 hypothetical protein [Dawidia cretensis]